MVCPLTFVGAFRPPSNTRADNAELLAQYVVNAFSGLFECNSALYHFFKNGLGSVVHNRTVNIVDDTRLLINSVLSVMQLGIQSAFS